MSTERKTSRLWRGSHLGLNSNWNFSEHQQIHVFKFTANERVSRLWRGSHLCLNSAGIDLNIKDSCVQVHHERKTSRLWRGAHLGLNSAGTDLNIKDA